MSLEPNIEEQQLLADTLSRVGDGLSTREHVSELVLGLGFAGVAALVWWALPPHGVAAVPAILSLLVLVLASRVRFDMPFGYTTATQLAFVPLLFALPVALVPVAVVVALTLVQLPEIVTGRAHRNRLLLTVGNSWFCIGPVAVFALAGTEPTHAGPVLLIAALVAQFGVDFAASSLRFWAERGARFSTQLRETWVYAVDAALSGIALVVAQEIHRTPVAALATVPLLALLAMFARERRQRMTGLIELSSAYQGTALVLGDVIEADDGYTGEHCKGVVALAMAIGQALGLDADRLRNLQFAALLHDVGKIAIPKEIINKPGKLDAAEWEIMKTHAVKGQEMLDRIGGFMHSVGVIVRSHHERWDGGGYPDNLAGEDIPLEARIIVCCDSWNAMRTDRSYRKALPFEVASEELVKHTGRQFDPNLVPVMLKVLADLGEGPATEASDGAAASLPEPPAASPPVLPPSPIAPEPAVPAVTAPEPVARELVGASVRR